MKECKNILFCTDFSGDTVNAFLYALDLAKKHNARLHIFHVPHSPYRYCKHIVDEHVPEGAPYGEAIFNEEIAEKAEEALRKEYEKKLGRFENYLFVVRAGSPDVEIIRYAKKNDIDEIVMGAVGKYHQDRFERGSIVDNVSKYSHFHVTAIGYPSSHNTETPGSA
jgi:nucleotide-binding universal stress UspA family protein